MFNINNNNKTMEVKGSAISSTLNYVKINHESEYDSWFNSLEEDSQQILKSISNSKWYPMKEGLLNPTQKIIDRFFDNDNKGAYKVGYHSADTGLNGIYKLFIKLGSPNFIISKTAKVFGMYYKGAKMEVISSTSESVILDITHFPEYSIIIEQRVIGWIEKALEITGCKNIKTSLVKSLAKNDDSTELFIVWN